MNRYLNDDLGFDEGGYPGSPFDYPCEDCAIHVMGQCSRCAESGARSARAVERWEALAKRRRLDDAQKNRRAQLLDITEKLRTLQIELAALLEEGANVSYVHYLVVRATRAAAAASRRKADTEPA